MENKIFECAIRTNNLTKVYGGAERVSDVSMSVGRGEIYGLIGKNGAGKTTLIRMILGIASPTRGNVELNGKSSPAELSRERRKIGALIEQPAFYPTMTAYDNVTGEVFEPEYEAGLGLIEDHSIGASGGLWVHGGIRIERKDGNVVATRNRVVLCRCGHSSNMPYCDGTHASLKWRDNLDGTPAGETIPEEVH